MNLRAFYPCIRKSFDRCHDYTSLYTLVKLQLVLSVGKQLIFVLYTRKHKYVMFSKPQVITAQKMKFSIIDFFSKCDQIRSFMQIWSHLLKKSLIENFIFYEVYKLAHLQKHQIQVYIVFHVLPLLNRSVQKTNYKRDVSFFLCRKQN